MDTYCEQLIRIKKGAKFYLGILGIWLTFALIAVLAFIFLNFISPIIIVAALYGAYYVSGFLSVEYEYIVTNGIFDIDIIYAKRSRKRVASFELSSVESIENFKTFLEGKNVLKACNLDDGNAYVLVTNSESKFSTVVISPDERTKQEILKYVPKFVGNTAFR